MEGGLEDDSVFGSDPWAAAATRGLLLLVFMWAQRPVGCLVFSAATGGLRKTLTVFRLGVFFPQDGCVPLPCFAFGCMGICYFLYVSMRLASSRKGIERTAGALLCSNSPPLDLVHPWGRLC